MIPKGGDFWAVVSAEMGTRNFNQCRNRWLHHLDPAIVKSEWNPEQDWQLFKQLITTPQLIYVYQSHTLPIFSIKDGDFVDAHDIIWSESGEKLEK